MHALRPVATSENDVGGGISHSMHCRMCQRASGPSGEWNDDDYDVRADDKEQYHYLRLATGGGL